MAKVLNGLVICFEILGFKDSIPKRKLAILMFYTQLSNLVTILSSVLFLIIGEKAAWMRYLSTCMLTMTFMVTLFVLVPMGGGFKQLMLSGNGLYHHTLCPIVSVLSYVFLEPHAGIWQIPVAVTMAYGFIMMLLNGLGICDGPYPFFRVRQQPVYATILWAIVLFLLISGVSLLFARLG